MPSPVALATTCWPTPRRNPLTKTSRSSRVFRGVTTTRDQQPGGVDKADVPVMVAVTTGGQGEKLGAVTGVTTTRDQQPDVPVMMAVRAEMAPRDGSDVSDLMTPDVAIEIWWRRPPVGVTGTSSRGCRWRA